MLVCPKCRKEFEDSTQTCPECDVQLMAPDNLDAFIAENLEIATTVTQEEDAYILQGFLENEGIPCQLENLTFHAEPIPVGGLTKVRLWTRKEDAAKARQLIHEHEQFGVCSACGHVALAEDATCDFCGEKLEPA